MTQTDKMLLALVKCAVCGREGVSVNDTDWLEVFTLSNMQAVGERRTPWWKKNVE